jgi:hypothetical protein
LGSFFASSGSGLRFCDSLIVNLCVEGFGICDLSNLAGRLTGFLVNSTRKLVCVCIRTIGAVGCFMFGYMFYDAGRDYQIEMVSLGPHMNGIIL